MNDFFISDSIFLRPLEPEDLEFFYKWENDTTLWKHGSTIVPFSRFALRQYIADSQLDIFQSRQLRMMIVEKESNVTVGTIDLYDFDALNSRAGVGILVDEDFQKRGYASQALSCMEDYAFGHLKLHQLYAFVPEGNLPSLLLFEKVGYQKTAVLKDWISVSKTFDDVIVMQKVNKIIQRS
ncbi:MAG: GNAT family N-acetyltransferase [Petrimonas sp.]|jgi:diamine N-acetyltransferase|nr:MAG: Spermidine N(1)-acetyltransferase [Bacteroidetes bacterium ADurb.BinA174]